MWGTVKIPATIKNERTFYYLAIVILGFIGFFNLLQTYFAVYVSYVPIPFSDHWGAILSKDIIANFFTQHNEHRIILFRALTIADNLLLHSLFLTHYVMSAIFQCVTLLSVIALAWIAGVRERRDLVIIGCFGLVLLFWGMQAENFLWAFQVQFFGVYSFAILSFLLITYCPGWMGVGLSLLACAASVGSIANGVLVAILLPWLAYVQQRRLREVFVLIFFAFLLVFLYMKGFHRVEHHGNPFEAWRKLGKIFTYLMVYLGSPLAQAFPGAAPGLKIKLAMIFGITGSILLAAFAWIYVRSDWAKNNAVSALLAVVIFVFLTGGITALGRVDFGHGQALSSRYLTSALSFWLALWAVAYVMTRNTGRVIVVCMAVLFALATPFTRVTISQLALSWLRNADAAATAGLSDVVDPEAFRGVFPDPNFVEGRMTIMRPAELGIFSWREAGWLGSPLAERARIAPEQTCMGVVDTPKVIETRPDAISVRLSGWGWNSELRAPFWKVLLTNSKGNIVGYGLVDTDRPDGKTALKLKRQALLGWRGHAKVTGPDVLTAYGVYEGGRQACAIGSVSVP